MPCWEDSLPSTQGAEWYLTQQPLGEGGSYLAQPSKLWFRNTQVKTWHLFDTSRRALQYLSFKGGDWNTAAAVSQWITQKIIKKSPRRKGFLFLTCWTSRWCFHGSQSSTSVMPITICGKFLSSAKENHCLTWVSQDILPPGYLR